MSRGIFFSNNLKNVNHSFHFHEKVSQFDIYSTVEFEFSMCSPLNEKTGVWIQRVQSRNLNFEISQISLKKQSK